MEQPFRTTTHHIDNNGIKQASIIKSSAEEIRFGYTKEEQEYIASIKF